MLAFDKLAPPFSGNRWKFWDAAPPLAPLIGELCEVGDAPLDPDARVTASLICDDGASLPAIVFVDAPLAWEGGTALVEAPPAALELGALADFGTLVEFAKLAPVEAPDDDGAVFPEALMFPDLLPLEPAPPVRVEGPFEPPPEACT